MSRYAENTNVTADRSRAEIELTLVRYGADQFMYGWEESRAVVQFRAHNRLIRFLLSMPDRIDPEISLTPTGRVRAPNQVEEKLAQATKQRWRALLLVIKAKLEAVQSGITEFDAEFLPHIVLPDGQTVGDWIIPQVNTAYELGEMPKALPMLTDGES